MNFKKITFDCKEEFDKYFKYTPYKSADYSTAMVLLWSDFYEMEYAIVEDMLVFHDNEGDDGSFSYPIGNGDEKKALEAIMDYCKEKDIPFEINGILKETEEKMIQMFGDIFETEYDRDIADYLYSSESLATLKGKKLHGKRNHINRFKAEHDWSYEPLNDENALETITMLMEWKMKNCSEEDEEEKEEICAAKKALIYFKELNLVGGVLRSEGRIVAFSVGEPINDKVFVVHFEKAFGEIQGTYAMINQQFIQHEATEYEFINREEDLGEEGLRKAKLSYRPVELVEKGMLKYK